MPPDLGLAELLKPLFQTGLAFVRSLMSLSEKLFSGLPFIKLPQNATEFATEFQSIERNLNGGFSSKAFHDVRKVFLDLLFVHGTHTNNS